MFQRLYPRKHYFFRSQGLQQAPKHDAKTNTQTNAFQSIEKCFKMTSFGTPLGEVHQVTFSSLFVLWIVLGISGIEMASRFFFRAPEGAQKSHFGVHLWPPQERILRILALLRNLFSQASIENLKTLIQTRNT